MRFQAVVVGIAASSGLAQAQDTGPEAVPRSSISIQLSAPTWNQNFVGVSGGWADAGNLGGDFALGFSSDLGGETSGGLLGMRLGLDRELYRLNDGDGFDRLVGSLVLDLHGLDLGTASNVDRTTSVINEPPCGGPDGGSDCFVRERGTVSTEIEGMATLRGRFGIADDRVFVYGTGGLAYAKAQVASQVSTSYGEDAAEALLNDGQEITGATPLPAGCASQSEPEPTETPVTCSRRKTDTDEWIGAALGVGVEYRISESVSLGAEYLHLDFDEGDIDTVAVNLNWRF